jgi:nicotinate-nucleotide adenylyltransferase
VAVSKQATGILGGAFDPPHHGHVALAIGGMAHFELERLHVRVVALPGHKEVATPAAVRLALARLAFADIVGVDASVDPHARTVEQLTALALDDPVFLIGADEFGDFLSWKEPDRILELAKVGVGTRPGTARDRVDQVLKRLERPDRVDLFEIEAHDLASSDLRRRVAAGEPLDGLVTGPVADAIDRFGLYRAP